MKIIYGYLLTLLVLLTLVQALQAEKFPRNLDYHHLGCRIDQQVDGRWKLTVYTIYADAEWEQAHSFQATPAVCFKYCGQSMSKLEKRRTKDSVRIKSATSSLQSTTGSVEITKYPLRAPYESQAQLRSREYDELEWRPE